MSTPRTIDLRTRGTQHGFIRPVLGGGRERDFGG